MVTQDIALLHRSIADNIRYGRPDATDAELRAAIEAAHAGFVHDLTGNKGRRGPGAHISERGVTLSGGQRQRVALAASCSRTPYPAARRSHAALNSAIEAAITENLHAIMQGKTVIAVAHRLSTIAELDRLVVIDRGAIVETGTHDELIARNGLYARLWAMQ